MTLHYNLKLLFAEVVGRIRQRMKRSKRLLKARKALHVCTPADVFCFASRLVVHAISFFMQFNTLRRHENSSMLSPGQRANSISRQAYNAFGSFQYPHVPAATLANCYQTGLFTDIFRSSRVFPVSGISTFEKGHEQKLKGKSKIHVAFIQQCRSRQHSQPLGK